MSMNIFGTKLQQGRHYMTLWPRRPELNSMFPENRVIKATEFALKIIPALAVLSVMLQFQLGELWLYGSYTSSQALSASRVVWNAEAIDTLNSRRSSLNAVTTIHPNATPSTMPRIVTSAPAPARSNCITCS